MEASDPCVVRLTKGHDKAGLDLCLPLQELGNVEFGQCRRERREVFMTGAILPVAVEILRLRRSSLGIRGKKMVDPLDPASGAQISASKIRAARALSSVNLACCVCARRFLMASRLASWTFPASAPRAGKGSTTESFVQEFPLARGGRA